MPVYNAEKTLSEALESILKQTYGNFELLVCDDKSMDHSLEILQAYARLDSRVKVFANDVNSGALNTRKRLFLQAQGEYSMWTDSDDTMSPDFFEYGARCIEEIPDTDILEFPYDVIFPDGKVTLIQRPDLLVKTDTLSRFFFSENRPHVWYMWSKFFRTSVVKQALPPYASVILDDVFYGQKLFHYSKVYRWVASDHAMYHYKIGGGTWSRLGMTADLTTFQKTCYMRALQIVYNMQFAVQEHYSKKMLLQIVNFADLQMLINDIAKVPVQDRDAFLKTFCSFFCRNNQ